MFDIQTLLEVFLNMSLRSACFTDEFYFLVKKENIRFWNCSLQILDYHDFGIIRHQINRVLLYNIEFINHSCLV